MAPYVPGEQNDNVAIQPGFKFIPFHVVLNLSSTLISVTEVFIAHGSHCKDCEDAVLSVATYLDTTGLCKCIPNLRSLPKEWSPSKTQYYENQIEKCQKVIVLFTVNENHEFEDNIKGKDGDRPASIGTREGKNGGGRKFSRRSSIFLTPIFFKVVEKICRTL